MFVQNSIYSLETRVQLWLSPNNGIFSFFLSLNSPYHFYTEEQFVCHGVWDIGPHRGHYTDSTVISGKQSQRPMNLPTVPEDQGLFSAINLINILIMNLVDSTIRSSSFQTGAFCDKSALRWGEGPLRFQVLSSPSAQPLISAWPIHPVISCVL